MRRGNTPFDSLIVRLGEPALRRQVVDPKDLFVAQQLRLLGASYLLMKRIDLRAKMSRSPDPTSDGLRYLLLELPHDSCEIVLHYFMFVSILNQLGRVLVTKYQSPDLVPRYTRIRFFRNKVLEHWDDYSESRPGGEGISQRVGKPPVPLTEKVHLLRDRKDLGDKLVERFAQLGIDIKHVDFSASGQSSTEDYCTDVYVALECIDPSLQNVSDDITNLLLKLGFPLPITDIDQYAGDLVEALGQQQDRPS